MVRCGIASLKEIFPREASLVPDSVTGSVELGLVVKTIYQSNTCIQGLCAETALF